MARLKWLIVCIVSIAHAMAMHVRPWFTHLRKQATAGQGLVEYALILVLIAIVVIGALTLVGRQTSDVYAEINCGLSGGQYHQDNGNGNSNKCN